MIPIRKFQLLHLSRPLHREQQVLLTADVVHEVVSPDGIGVKPNRLLLIAVASYSAVDVVEILEKKRMPLTHLEISVSGEQDQDPPRTFRKIFINYRIGGKNLTDKAVSQVIQLSQEKYCSVAATIRGTAQIVTENEILEEMIAALPA